MREEDIKYIHELENLVQNLESRLAFEQGVTSYLQSKNKRYREAIKNIEKGYKRILSEQSTRLLTEQYTRVSNLKFIRDEIKALEETE